MRLRYLELPRYGPLIDLAIVFGQEEMLFGWTPEDQARRRGAINFVVGVNGTGKSSLLRAIFQTFRALMLNDMPAQPVTLAWDRTASGATVTAILRVPADSSVEAPWFAIVKPVADGATEGDWRMLIQNQGKGPLGSPIDLVGNGDPITTSLTQAHLPTKLVAYTSGTEMLWVVSNSRTCTLTAARSPVGPLRTTVRRVGPLNERWKKSSRFESIMCCPGCPQRNLALRFRLNAWLSTWSP